MQNLKLLLITISIFILPYAGMASLSSDTTFTNDITIAKSNPSLNLNRNSTTQIAGLIYQTTGANNWFVGTPQDGVIGSDFQIFNYGLSQKTLWFNYASNTATFSGSVIAPSYAIIGGTGSQFLKGDGSLDANTYATTSALSGYLPLTSGVLTGDLTISKTNAAINISRGTTGNIAGVIYQTAGANNWFVGIPQDGVIGSDFQLYNYGLSSKALWIDYSNNATTLGGELIGKSAKFDDEVFVNGYITTKKIIVTQSGWPDYVFHPTYELKPLSEVASFIKQNQHLPDVPSAKEVEDNGISLGDNQAVLLRKIEELTLYLIEIKNENANMKEKMEQLEKKINK